MSTNADSNSPSSGSNRGGTGSSLGPPATSRSMPVLVSRLSAHSTTSSKAAPVPLSVPSVAALVAASNAASAAAAAAADSSLGAAATAQAYAAGSASAAAALSSAKARARTQRAAEWFVTLPSLAWLGVFFVVPAILIIITAFRPADLHGGVGAGWSLEALRALRDPAYAAIVWRTLWLGAASTAVCLALALPAAFHMARVGPRWRQFLLLLVVIPFLSNFLIRVFAWKSLLHPEGALTKLLISLRLVPEDALLLNNAGAVLLVLIYTQLPFAILPLYAAAEKFDFGLMDAARDLGAGPWRAFTQVFIPGVRRGLVSAAVMVFVSSLGQYVIPQLVGGASDEMLGSKIAQRVFADRNLPHASALAAALMLAVLAPMLIVAAWQRFGKTETSATTATP